MTSFLTNRSIDMLLIFICAAILALEVIAYQFIH